MTDQVFNSNDETDLSEIIGEGKKYKDQETALRSIPHKDSHIAILEQEAKDLRDELAKRLTTEELLRKQLAKPKEEKPSPIEEPANTNTQDESLDEKIKRALDNRTEAERTKANVEAVAKTLVDKFGGEKEANNYVLSKAKELGVQPEWLRDMAARSPDAFYKTVDVTVEAKVNASASKGTVNTGSLKTTQTGEPKEGTWSYYKKLQQDDPKKFHTMKVQSQMVKDALKHGEGFTKT